MFRPSTLFLAAIILFLWAMPLGCKKEIVKLGEKDHAVLSIDHRTGRVDISQNKRKAKSPRATEDGVQLPFGTRKTEITFSGDGTVVVKPITRGFVKEPGIVAFYGQETEISYGLGLQIWYWRQVGGFVSATWSPSAKSFQSQVSLGYNLKKLPNTSVLLGVDTNKDVVLGLTVRF